MSTPAPAALPPQPSREPELACTPDSTPALAALLDHIAEELAREYVRLMKAAADDEGVGPRRPESRGSLTMRAAIYARYSSENQRPESIADQIAACRRLAAERAFTVLDDHIYSDEAKSGPGATAWGSLRSSPPARRISSRWCWSTTSLAWLATTI